MNRNMTEQDYKEALKALKEERREFIERARARVKEQNGIFKKIKAAMAEGASTIPEIASSVDLPTESVFWHVTALKTYGQIEEAAKAGDYFSYRLVADKEQGE